MAILSPAQSKAYSLLVKFGKLEANGPLASKHRVTFATLISLEKKGMVSSDLKNGNWVFYPVLYSS